MSVWVKDAEQLSTNRAVILLNSGLGCETNPLI